MGAAGASRFSESEVSYYLSKVCIEADPVFRFAVAVTGDDQIAYKPIKGAMLKLAGELKARASADRDDNRVELVRLVWAGLLSQARLEAPKSGTLGEVFGSLDTQSRAILVASDVLGLSFPELAAVFKLSDGQIRKTLAEARRALCSRKLPASSDMNFFLEHIGDFLDENVPTDVSQKMDQLLKSSEYAELSEDYQRGLGQMQVILQGFFVGSDRMQELYELVEAPEIRQTQELARIEETERAEFASSVRKRILILLGLSVAIFSVVYYSTSPKRSQEFDPLRFLSLETIALIEDPSGRLDYLFKTDTVDVDSEEEGIEPAPVSEVSSQASISELQEYFDKHPEVDFKVNVLRVDPKTWEAVGGAVFDYDGISVAVVQYRSRDALQESIVQYVYKGQVSDLPPTEVGELKQDNYSLRYQAYGSDNLNIVSWQDQDAVVGMLMGTRGVVDLARIVAIGRKS